MIFVHPAWLGGGAVAVLIGLWTWRRHDLRQRRALRGFVSAQLGAELTGSLSAPRRRLRRAAFAAAVVLSCIALAEPQLGFRTEQVTRRGNDIVFAVDTSRSMLTPDVKPDRLTRAKLAVGDLVGRLDGDAVGLLAFAGTAFLQCPLTGDYDAFRESLAALDTRVIPLGGTDIASAIHAALAALRNRAGSDKLLILLTDGEDLEGNALQAARAAAQEGLKIYTVGVGTASGELIPVPADQGGGFLKDAEGRFVHSRLDEPALRAIASATGGAYRPLGVANQGLEAIYREAIAPLAKHDLAARSERIYLERYQWPLAGSLVVLLASQVIGTRRRSSTALLGLMAIALAPPLHASTASAAESAYRRGDYAEAQKDYAAAASDDPAPLLSFDAGAAAYKAGDYPAAAEQFRASLGAAKSGSSKRLAEQQDAYYNLGNALYREGEQSAASDPQKTMARWTGALKAYDSALQLRADDPDSRFNRDFVSRKLEQLQRQQKQKQSQPQQGQSPPKQGEQAQPPQGQQPAQQAQPRQEQPEHGAGPQGRAQQDPEPNAPPRPADPQAPNPVHGQTGESRPGATEARVPGEMSPEEAQQLLDSVKDEERRAPLVPSAQNSEGGASPPRPARDW